MINIESINCAKDIFHDGNEISYQLHPYIVAQYSTLVWRYPLDCRALLGSQSETRLLPSVCLACEIPIGINYMVLSTTKNRVTCWTTSPVERATTLQAREVGYSSRGPGQGCRGPGLSNNQDHWSLKCTTFCCTSCKIGRRFKIKLSSFKLGHQMTFFWHSFKLALDDGIQHQHTDKVRESKLTQSGFGCFTYPQYLHQVPRGLILKRIKEKMDLHPKEYFPQDIVLFHIAWLLLLHFLNL